MKKVLVLLKIALERPNCSLKEIVKGLLKNFLNAEARKIRRIINCNAATLGINQILMNFRMRTSTKKDNMI